MRAPRAHRYGMDQLRDGRSARPSQCELGCHSARPTAGDRDRVAGPGWGERQSHVRPPRLCASEAGLRPSRAIHIDWHESRRGVPLAATWVAVCDVGRDRLRSAPPGSPTSSVSSAGGGSGLTSTRGACRCVTDGCPGGFDAADPSCHRGQDRLRVASCADRRTGGCRSRSRRARTGHGRGRIAPARSSGVGRGWQQR